MNEELPHPEERQAVARCMRRLYRMKLTTTSGGNISLRQDGDRILMTPGGGDKAATRGDEIAILTLAGETLTPTLKHSSEYQMHLEIYKAREDVRAIVHAHPPVASAFTATAAEIHPDLTAESYAILGRVAFVPYVLTGTLELAQACAQTARDAECLLLENHGITALGGTLLEAFNRMEVLEAAAHHTLTTRMLGGGKRLTAERLAELDHHYGLKK